MPRAPKQDAPIRLEEEPVDDGLRMALYFDDEQLVDVEYVDPRYAATLRGAMMLIGGMRQAEELEDG